MTSSGITPYALDYALFGGDGREEIGSPNLFRYYLKDHLGSTRAVWAPDVAQLIEATGYLPYGTQIPIITPTANEAAREKFTGKELDKDGVGTDLADETSNTVTGVQLSYFGARYYDAMTGAWVTRDPKGQFHSPYTYAGDCPLILVDPNRNDAAKLGIQLSGGAAAGGMTEYGILFGISPFQFGTYTTDGGGVYGGVGGVGGSMDLTFGLSKMTIIDNANGTSITTGGSLLGWGGEVSLPTDKPDDASQAWKNSMDSISFGLHASTTAIAEGHLMVENTMVINWTSLGSIISSAASWALNGWLKMCFPCSP